MAETSRHQYPVRLGQPLFDGIRRDLAAVRPQDLDPSLGLYPRVSQRLGDGQIGVVQLNVFADHGDLHRAFGVSCPFQHRVPLAHIRLSRIKSEFAADDRREVFALEHDRRLIEQRHGDVVDHAVAVDVAKHRDLVLDVVRKRQVGARDDDVGANAHALQLLDRVLRGL